MAKLTFTINDFSGGTNGYVDPLDIADNELAQCQGFKAESGIVSVLGDMKGAYTPSSANSSDSIAIEPGYGIFAFAHDYDKDGDLNTTQYLVLMDGVTFDVYDDDGDAWLASRFNLGTVAVSGGTGEGAGFAESVKPCFFVADGALRVSPGNFDNEMDNGETVDGAIAANAVYGAYHTITVDANTASDHMTAGDTIRISKQEMIVLKVVDVGGGDDTIHVARNMTGTFTSKLANNATIYSMLETRWRGIVIRRNFADVTADGSFTEWYSTYSNPRPPVLHDAAIDYDGVTDHTMWPFLVAWYKEDATPLNDGNAAGVLNVGWFEDTDNPDATWDGAVINLYVTALYDDAKQESQPHKYVAATITVPEAKELAVWIGVEYIDDGGNSYRINKRVTGARLYYEDTTNDPGILFQLLEIDFEKGCKKAEAETFSAWVEDDADISVGCPAVAGAAHGSRTGANVFIFETPPKAFTYEFNTGYPPDINTHARYKTAVVANRRLFVGNVYQSGKANGDRMISSPINKFDILPEYGDYVIDATVGDGDEIIKLEAYADRILQFKKRTLYIINVGGGLGEEFIESQHRNMGVENPSQTCMTEYGVAWVNAHGVFMYDGQEITDLTREKLQLTNTTATERPRALNIIESNIPLIGYHPDNKWLIVHVASNISTDFEAEAWIHDFKNGSWTKSAEFSADAYYKSNMIWTPDNNLVFASGTNSSFNPLFYKYRDAGTATPAQDLLILRTKDFNLNAPGVKKKLRSVYVTYSANGSSEIQAHILFQKASGTATVESELVEADGGSTYYTEADGFKTTSNAVYTVELVPSTTVTDAMSFQLQLKNDDAAALATSNFKLYDIAFVYRPLGTR